jgi:hypothetical protein
VNKNEKAATLHCEWNKSKATTSFLLLFPILEIKIKQRYEAYWRIIFTYEGQNTHPLTSNQNPSIKVKYKGEIKDSAANTNPNMEVERKKIKNSVTKE